MKRKQHGVQVAGTSNPEVEDALAAWLAEYNSLRTEIEWLIQDGTSYQNYAITLLGILGAAIGWLLNEASVLLLPSLLIIPVIFTLLGFLYIRQHEEVFIVAAYLKEYVRPRVRELVREPMLWGWEEFKTARLKRNNRRRGHFLNSTDIIILLRGALFILPSVVTLILALLSMLGVAPFEFARVTIWPLSTIIVILFILDILLVLVLVYYLFFKGRSLPRDLEDADA